MKYTVDRIEEGIAVCIGDDMTSFNIAEAEFAAIAGRLPKANDIFEAELEGGGIISIRMLDDERDAMLKENARRLNALFRRNKNDNGRERNGNEN